jgi:hypothetical protein
MLWMPPQGTVIEVRFSVHLIPQSQHGRQIFPPNVFLRDYQIVAEALGHTHIATVRLPFSHRAYFPCLRFNTL